ncbi:MAG: hypothetical protein M0019_08605 [Actinomycetota bacterium]|nr:hypothetical protein [Actinomycetota bacterium]
MYSTKRIFQRSASAGSIPTPNLGLWSARTYFSPELSQKAAAEYSRGSGAGI